MGWNLERHARRKSDDRIPRPSARGGGQTVVAAATSVEDHGFTPFDTRHLVDSDGDTIVSSDDTYESVAPRVDLTAVDDE